MVVLVDIYLYRFLPGLTEVVSRKQFLETLSASATFLPLIVNLFRDLQIPGNSVGPVIYQPRATKRNSIT